MGYLWAPPEYRWTDLVNSEVHDHRGSGRREDRLEIDEWLESFLGLCGYERARLPGAEGRAELRRFRTDMARLVSMVVAGQEPPRKELESFNRKYLRCAASQPRIEWARDHFEVQQIPATHGLDRIVGQLALNFAETLACGERERIKICANPDCRWVMYDTSRNRTRRWCEAGACGNLMKVRQFRARHARARRYASA